MEFDLAKINKAARRPEKRRKQAKTTASRDADRKAMLQQKANAAKLAQRVKRLRDEIVRGFPFTGAQRHSPAERYRQLLLSHCDELTRILESH